MRPRASTMQPILNPLTENHQSSGAGTPVESAGLVGSMSDWDDHGSRRSDGPWMARNGFVVVMLLALSGLIFAVLARPPHLTADLWFFGGELALELALFALSFSELFRQRWEEIVLSDALILIAAIAVTTVVVGTFQQALLGLLLLQLGTAAFLPWHPRRQLWLNAASVLCLAIFTILTPHSWPGIFITWVVLLTGAATAQVASTASYRFRRESEERMRTVLRAQNRLAEEIREREKLIKSLNAVFDVSLSAISVVRATDARYLRVNREFLRESGLTNADVLGKTDVELGVWLNEEDRVRVTTALARDGQVRNMEVDFRRSNGVVVPSLLSAALVEIGDEQCVVSYSRDVTDLREAQRQLVAAREAALAASRKKTEFLSNMSHEIRTPMNSVLGSAELLAETPLSAEQRQYVQMIRNNGAMLLELINSILDLAKVESGRLSLEVVEFDLCDLVEKVVDSIALKAHEKGLELLVRFASGLGPRVMGDQLRLRQILTNLLSNAIKFTSQGQVIVTVDPVDSSEGGIFRFSVADTGIGIPPDRLGQIFEPFTQGTPSTHRAYGGSGLGLAIVVGLVASMGGDVQVQSKVGTGSTFAFTLQLRTVTAPLSQDRESFGELAGVSILVVDDNRDTRDTLCELLALRGAGITVRASLDEAASASDQARSAGRDFDVILVDSTLPQCPLTSLIQHTSRFAADLSRVIVMLTTEDLAGNAKHLYASGLRSYIVKPIKRADLLATISVVLRGRSASLPPEKVVRDTQMQRHALASFRVLVADDTPDNRLIIRMFLRDLPCEIDEAQDGSEAFDKFIRGNYDLVLMDMRMPILDGYQAVAEIRRWESETMRPRTPIIALTASALDHDVRRAAEAGCNLHLAKPVKKIVLLEAIKRSMAGVAVERPRPIN
jgi:PAS domain S-box-containing protein